MEVPRTPATQEEGLSRALPLCQELPRSAQVPHLLPRCVLTRPQRPPWDPGSQEW